MKKTFILIFVIVSLLALFSQTISAQDIQYETITKSFEISFEPGDDEIANTDIVDFFTVENFAGGTATVNNNGEGYIKGYSQIYISENVAYEYLTGEYSFQVDYVSSKTDNSAIFLRAIDPNTYTIKNPKNADIDQKFGFFEWDWYAENGGEHGTSGTGGSGIKIYETSTKICICIKTYVDDGLNICSETVEFKYPQRFKARQMNTCKFTDDGVGNIAVMINGVALCTIEYGGEAAAYPDGDDKDCPMLYYKQATVKDPDGNAVMTLDNARICAEYSGIAIGNRGTDKTIKFDNLVLTYSFNKPIATPTLRPTAIPIDKLPTREPTQAPENRQTEDGGCRSASGIAQIMLILGATLIIRKKK